MQIWARILFVLSIWGAFQLGIMGIAYYTRSPVMRLDVHYKASKNDSFFPSETYLSKVYNSYTNASRRCFMAAVLYLLLLSSLTFLTQMHLIGSSGD